MPTNIHGVVCTVDFSSFSPLVVAQGQALAARAGIPLSLFHAIHDPQDRVHASTLFERGGDLSHAREKARHQMLALLGDGSDTGPVAIDIAFGDPVEQLLAYLAAGPPRLVVSASHGISGLQRMLVGTVVERLVRALPHPMLVIRPAGGEKKDPLDGFARVVVGCDAGGRWLHLQQLMAMLEGPAGLALHLIHALERPVGDQDPDAPVKDYRHSQQSLQLGLQKQLYRRARDRFPSAAILATVVPGDPARTLLAAADEVDADLIVVGVRRSGRVARWIAGSTTEAVLRHAVCSVLTLPEDCLNDARSGDRP